MPKFKIQHITRYLYEDAVRDSANQIMLYPIPDDYQEVLHHLITISGNPQVNLHDDYYGNKIGTFTYAQPHREMIINSQLGVETKPRQMPPDDVSQELQWNELRSFRQQFTYIDFLKLERFPAFEEVERIIAAEREKKNSPFQTAKNLCKYVFENFAYKKGITTVETTLEEIWKLKSGVCQDFAHILLAMLRVAEIPARYVSGYVCPNRKGMRGEGATHAWVEAYLPFFGWLGMDPTNNCLVNETHVRLAVGKNFSDCSPVKGTYRGTSDHTLEVSVTVSYEDGHTSDDQQTVEQPEPTTSTYKNSFRRHQEMQMQQ